MSNARLTTAVDALVASVRALVPPEAPPEQLRAFDVALGDLLAEVLNAASAQSAGATLTLLDDLHQRLPALEQRGQAAQ